MFDFYFFLFVLMFSATLFLELIRKYKRRKENFKEVLNQLTKSLELVTKLL